MQQFVLGTLHRMLETFVFIAACFVLGHSYQYGEMVVASVLCTGFSSKHVKLLCTLMPGWALESHAGSCQFLEVASNSASLL